MQTVSVAGCYFSEEGIKQLSKFFLFFLTGWSATAEWLAGEQAAASFQPAGSSRQDKASLFKTPPTPQRK